MRRNDMTQMSAAELAICEAMRQVEGMGADPRLTRAVTLLQSARDGVADFIDKVPLKVDEPKKPDKPEPKK